MGTLIGKLNAVNTSKEQIRQAIERKRVSIPKSTPLKDYPAKIDAIYPDAIFMRECNFGNGCTATVGRYTFTQWAAKVVYGNGIYIGYDLATSYTEYSNPEDAIIVKSSNEADWVRVAISKPENIVFFNGVFVCMYNSTYDDVIWSADGKTWKACTMNGGDNYLGGLFLIDNNYLYIVKNKSSDDGSTIHLYRTSDGKTFTKIDSSGFPSQGYPITSIVYSDKFKKYYMCKSKYLGGAPRYAYYYSSNLTKWTKFGDNEGGSGVDLDGDFRLVGDRLYCNFFRKQSSSVALWSQYTDDGTTWKLIKYTDTNGTDTNINVFSYVNGTYFAYTCNYDSGNKYTLWYSNNGIDGWQEYELPISLKSEPVWSVCNGIVFNMTLQSTNAEYVVLTSNYSFDGFTWFDEIHSMFIDVNDENVTDKVMKNFSSGYSPDMLNKAYNAGVNSI